MSVGTVLVNDGRNPTRADAYNLRTELKHASHIGSHIHHSSRFQNPPRTTHEHPLIYLHAAIITLPIETSDLASVGPEFQWVKIGRAYPSALWVYTAKVGTSMCD